MIYTPQNNPKKAMVLISVIVVAGILGSIFFSKYFAIVALLYWIQFTAVLSYKQFAKKRKYKVTSITTFLLNPQFRFFIFVFVATIGILSIFMLTAVIAYISLMVWWLFSFNFYLYYKRYTK